jgi:serine/threonine protein kinase
MGKQDLIITDEIGECLTQEARETLFASMEEKRFKAGERLITRGEKGDKLFIIQDGTCRVIIEKDGEAYPIVLLKPGELAGEMALITGEPRTAHVDAETDVVVAEISREKFDSVCEVHPSLREILSKIVQENIFSSIFREQREVGKYSIQDILRKGGMSTDYKGVHRYLNMPVVIKVLRNDIVMDPDFFDKFKEDAVKIVQLNHENIVAVFDIASLYRTIFIFREYLEGELLQTIMDRAPQQPLTLNRVIDLLQQICSGLVHAHEKGLIHKGINPHNILILPNDRVKLIDFGLAFPKGEINVSLGERIKYMSPEQIKGDPLDERTDIYSLGILAFEMITGQKPFENHDVDKFFDMHAAQELPDPRSLSPDLPDGLYRLIIKATQKSPGNRYQNISEIIRAL